MHIVLYLNKKKKLTAQYFAVWVLFLLLVAEFDSFMTL